MWKAIVTAIKEDPRDMGDITHLVVALGLFAISTVLPKWAMFGMMNMVMWYLYEYGQFHMTIKYKDLDVPWWRKCCPFLWSKNHWREFIVPTIAGWMVAVGLIGTI